MPTKIRIQQILNFASNVISSALTGFTTANGNPVTATDTIVGAAGKLQAQINGLSPTSLTPKQVVFGSSSNAIQQDSAFVFDPTTKTISNGVTSINTSTFSIQVVGDSVALGTGSTSTAFRWTTLLCNRLGYTQVNLAVGGTQVTNASSTIPTYVSGMAFLVMEYGINDFRDPTVTSTIFQTNYTAALANAISKGWQYNQIIIVDISASVNDYVGNPTSLDKIQSFNTVMQNLCTTNGCIYASIFVPMQATPYGGQPFISADGTHPNNFGHNLISYFVAEAMPKAFNITNQPLVINGAANFSEILLKSNNLISNGSLVAIDGNGNLGETVVLPPNIKTNGVLTQDGNLVGKFAVYPDVYDAVNDHIWAEGYMDHCYYTSNDGVSFQLCDVNGRTNWWNRDPSGATVIGSVTIGKFNWYVSLGVVGARNLAMYIGVMGDTLTNYNFIFNNFGYIGGAFNSNDYGRHYPYSTQGNQDFMLNHATGRFKFLWGNGTSPSVSEIAAIGPNGVELVNLTSTQREGMSYVKSIAVVSGGSAYASAPTITLRAPDTAGGIQATATANISGGVITSITITNQGSGYLTVPTYTITGGGGSGATVLPGISGLAVPGLTIFNTTTNLMNYFNGTQWMAITATAA